MRLLNAGLKQFCQYEELNVDFAPGLNAIIGDNGVGKSNLFRALRGAFTNDFTNADGVKLDNVRRQAQPRSHSQVHVDFINQAGTPATLVRSLRGGKDRLSWGGTAVHGDKEVGPALAALLGVDLRILLDYVFVPQWRVFDFLAQTRAQRLEAFQRLFGADAVEAAYEAVNRRCNTLVLPDPVDLDRLRDEQARVHAELAAAEHAYTDYAGLPPRPAERDDPDRKIMRAYEAMTAAADEAKRASTEAATLRQQHAASLATDTELAEYLAGLTGPLAQTQADYDKARQHLAAWAQYQRVRTQQQQLGAELERLRTEELTTKPPPKPDEYLAERAAFTAELTRKVDRLKQLRHFVEACNVPAGGAVCPHCGTPAVDLRLRLPVYQAEHAELQPVVERLQRIAAAAAAYDQQLASYERGQRQRQQRRASVQQQQASLADLQPPPEEEAELRALVQDYEGLQRAATELRQECDDHRRQTERLQARLDAALAAQARANAVVASVPYTQEQAAQAEASWTRRLAVYEARARLEGRLEGLRRDATRADQAVQTGEAAAARAVKLRHWGGRLEDWRPILHRDQLPALMIRYRLHELLPRLNGFLATFEADYRVRIDDDASFLADFHIGPQAGETFAQQRLSGGQKVVLALAFRMALNNTGLLCLDEATAGLDAARLGCVQRALQRLRALSSDAGLQVVLVTHERSLDKCFDNIIELKGT